jgi:hypothetical protein
MANHEATQTPASEMESLTSSPKAKFAELLIKAGKVLLAAAAVDLVAGVSHQPETLAGMGLMIGLLGVNLKTSIIEKQMDLLDRMG